MKDVSDLTDMEFMYLIGHLGGWYGSGRNVESWAAYWGFSVEQMQALELRAKLLRTHLEGEEVVKS